VANSHWLRIQCVNRVFALTLTMKTVQRRPGIVVVLALALIGSTIGSAFATPPTKPASKRISRYMRDMGILYLEAVEKLTLECGQKSSSDDDCKSRWESTMSSIEDRVDIALSDESRQRSSGDAPYWDLLKNVRYARYFYVIADPEQRKAWSHAYITCRAYAHTVALEGSYFNGDGGCGTAIDAATQAANQQ
jgi:hypothetical protein